MHIINKTIPIYNIDNSPSSGNPWFTRCRSVADACGAQWRWPNSSMMAVSVAATSMGLQAPEARTQEANVVVSDVVPMRQHLKLGGRTGRGPRTGADESTVVHRAAPHLALDQCRDCRHPAECRQWPLNGVSNHCVGTGSSIVHWRRLPRPPFTATGRLGWLEKSAKRQHCTGSTQGLQHEWCLHKI